MFAGPSGIALLPQMMRIGGKFRARMEAKNESFGLHLEALYDEIVEEQKFTCIMPDSMQITVD